MGKWFKRREKDEEESWLQVCVVTDSGLKVYVCKSCGATREEDQPMFHYDIGPGKKCSDEFK